MSTQRALRRAGKYAKAGQYDLAEKEYTALLANFPANVRAKDGLAQLRSLASIDGRPTHRELQGVAHLLKQGRAQQARNDVTKLLVRFPNNHSVTQLAGLVMAACKEPDKAMPFYRRALRGAPEDAETLFNLANSLREMGDTQGALETYGEVIKNRPDYTSAYRNIGVILTGMGQLEAAESTFQQAILLAPDDAVHHRNLGKVYFFARKFGEAVNCFTRAHSLSPPDADTWLELGNAYYCDDQLEQAGTALQAGLDLRPDDVATMNSLAGVYRSQGQIEKAQALYEKIVQMNPGYCAAHYNLSTLKRYRPGDAQMQVMLTVQADNAGSDDERMNIGFALAKAHTDIGETARAFESLKTANDLKRAGSSYDIARDNAVFQIIRASFEGNHQGLSPGTDCERLTGSAPVFIVGMPRSGSTLSEQILASHDDVFGAGELAFLGCAVRQSGWTEGAVDSVMLHNIRRDYLQSLATRLPDINGRDDISPKFVTDKMPLNFRLVGFILNALPEARIVHVKRDARATCWSIYSHYFSERSNAYGFAYDLVELSTYYRMYLSMMAFWHARFPDRIYDLSYEALSEDQTSETRALLAHLGLDWQAQCLEFQNTNRSVRTASALQVRQKMYQGSSDKWRDFEEFLKPMTDILHGY